MLQNAEYIHSCADRIIRKCQTRNAEKIASFLGIYLHYNNQFENLLGMYVCKYRERHIILNGNMEDALLQMVCGHELGHDCLHRQLAKQSYLQEFELFDMRTSVEYEANAFAAHILIDDDELIDLMRQEYDFVQISSIMGVHINLMLVKLNEMNRMGWNLNLPYVPRSDFLKEISPN